MNAVEQALRDVQFLSRQIVKDSPRTAEALHLVYKLAANRRESVFISASVVTDAHFISRFRDWDYNCHCAGIQELTVAQIIDLRHFAIGALVRLENQPQPHRQLAYRYLVVDCDRALQTMTM